MNPPVIDAHQHLWKLADGYHQWLSPKRNTIHRDFLPEDLSPLLASANVHGTILVQAAPSDQETDWLLELAAANAWILGVVGWVDIAAEESLLRIDYLNQSEWFVGIRAMLPTQPDNRWILNPENDSVLAILQERGLALDLLATPTHLSSIKTLAQRYPYLKIVLDHAAKPNLSSNNLSSWQNDMAEVALQDNVFCKLSGLTATLENNWQAEQLEPVVAILLDCFTGERLLWGSDWPVLLETSEYVEWMNSMNELVTDVNTREQVFGRTAVNVYCL